MRKNVYYFPRRLQLPGLSVPLFLLLGEMKLLRKNGWVLSAVRMALQAMRCTPAKAWIVWHLWMSCGNEGYGLMSSMQRESVGRLWFQLNKKLVFCVLMRLPLGA